MWWILCLQTQAFLLYLITQVNNHYHEVLDCFIIDHFSERQAWLHLTNMVWFAPFDQVWSAAEQQPHINHGSNSDVKAKSWAKYSWPWRGPDAFDQPLSSCPLFLQLVPEAEGTSFNKPDGFLPPLSCSAFLPIFLQHWILFCACIQRSVFW